MKPSRAADRAAFIRAARELYEQTADYTTGDIFCAECGRWLPPETVPHHIVGAGLGGRRDHSVGNMVYLCRPCHDKKHF